MPDPIPPVESTPPVDPAPPTDPTPNEELGGNADPVETPPPADPVEPTPPPADPAEASTPGEADPSEADDPKDPPGDPAPEWDASSFTGNLEDVPEDLRPVVEKLSAYFAAEQEKALEGQRATQAALAKQLEELSESLDPTKTSQFKELQEQLTAAQTQLEEMDRLKGRVSEFEAQAEAREDAEALEFVKKHSSFFLTEEDNLDAINTENMERYEKAVKSFDGLLNGEETIEYLTLPGYKHTVAKRALEQRTPYSVIKEFILPTLKDPREVAPGADIASEAQGLETPVKTTGKTARRTAADPVNLYQETAQAIKKLHERG